MLGRLSVSTASDSTSTTAHYRQDMAVTAKLVPDRIDLHPNTPTTLTLRLYNGDDGQRDVTLAASGDLIEHVRLDASNATIDANQILDVPVTVFAPSTVHAGTYSIVAEVTVVAGDASTETTDGSDVVVASTAVEVSALSDYSIALQPTRSRGARRGRHTIQVVNTGNVALTLGLSTNDTHGIDDTDGSAVSTVSTAIDTSLLDVAPGLSGRATVLVTPATTYWSGPTLEHQFTLHATSTLGRSDELVGTYQQRPRLPNWVGPAAAGALTALVLGAIAWFALLRPWVQDTADQAAADAIESDRAALQDRIDELEVAAAEAEELPLGTPIDFRLGVAPTGGNSEQDAAPVEAGTIVSITDVVFQNPTGAVGTVSLRRGGDILLQSELANFRDFDLHFVAPYQFDDDTEIVLDVECRTPGNGESTCPVAASLVGFVDEVD